MQNDGATEARDIFVFDVRCSRRHDYRGRYLEPPRREGDTLCVIAGTAGNYATPTMIRIQVGHLVVCASQFEAEDGLQVLALKQHIAFETVAQVGGVSERRFLDHFVNTRGQNEAKVLSDGSARPNSLASTSKWE